MESKARNTLESFNEVVPPIKLKSFTVLKSAKRLSEDHLRIVVALIALFHDFLDDPSLAEKVLEENEGINEQVFTAYYSRGIQMSKKIEKASRILEEGGIKPENVVWVRNALSQVKGDAFHAQSPVTEAVSNIYAYLVNFIIYYQNNYSLETTKRFHMNRNARTKTEKSAKPPSKNATSRIVTEDEPQVVQSIVKPDSCQNTRPPSIKRIIAAEYSRTVNSRDYKKKLGLVTVKPPAASGGSWAVERNISAVSRKTPNPVPLVNYQFPELKDSTMMECRPQRAQRSRKKSSVVFSEKVEEGFGPEACEIAESPMRENENVSFETDENKNTQEMIGSQEESLCPPVRHSEAYQLALPLELSPQSPSNPVVMEKLVEEISRFEPEKAESSSRLSATRPNALIPLSPINSKFTMSIPSLNPPLRLSLSGQVTNPISRPAQPQPTMLVDPQKEIEKIKTAIKVYSGDKTKGREVALRLSENSSKPNAASSRPGSVKGGASVKDFCKPRLSLRPAIAKNFSEIQTRVSARPAQTTSKPIEELLLKKEVEDNPKSLDDTPKAKPAPEPAINSKSSYANIFSRARSTAAFVTQAENSPPSQTKKPAKPSLPKSVSYVHSTPAKQPQKLRESVTSSINDAKESRTEEGLTIKNPRKEPKKWGKSVARSQSLGKVTQVHKSPTATNPNNSINLHAKSVIKTYIDNQNVRLSFFNDQREEKIQKKELNKLKMEMGHYKFLVDREAAQKVKEDQQERLKVSNYYAEFMEKYKNYAQTKAEEDKEYFSQVKGQAKAKHHADFEESQTNIANAIFAHKIEESRPSLGDVLGLSQRNSALFDSNAVRPRTNGDIYKEYAVARREVESKDLEKKKGNLQQELDYFKKLFAKNCS